jgi:hypothetical protein
MASNTQHTDEASSPVRRLSTAEEVGKTDRGYTIFREANGAGGHTYFSDEVGGGVTVWDTCLVDRATLMEVIAMEDRRAYHNDEVHRTEVHHACPRKPVEPPTPAPYDGKWVNERIKPTEYWLVEGNKITFHKANGEVIDSVWSLFSFSTRVDEGEFVRPSDTESPAQKYKGRWVVNADFWQGGSYWTFDGEALFYTRQDGVKIRAIIPVDTFFKGITQGNYVRCDENGRKL